VERVAGVLRGGSPAWLLAVRRLQLDSATAARLVGGIAVVLAGSIALQGVYARAESDQPPAGDVRVLATAFVTSVADVEAFTTALHALPGLAAVPVETRGLVRNSAGEESSVVVGTCGEFAIAGCRDGDVYAMGAGAPGPGETVRFANSPQWTVPADRYHRHTGEGPGLLVTTGALADATNVSLSANATIPAAGPDVVEGVRNVVGWNGVVASLGTGRDGTYALITRVLSVGSVLVLLLAAGSLLIAAWEQLRERRRSLAALMANGVGRGVLARSLLWQLAIPVVVAVFVAVLAGLGLDWLLLTWVVHRPMVVDLATIGVLTATAAAAVLVVTAVTLPVLWRSAGLEQLREE
ncbi:FtsX-like permease family protein, partial [Amycolatopsis sp. SID8362]|uniref:FtsX-like permease family protein n=1 Tax=Amycolatopsis sp. SID8362 TaxID=2690346 RepID=UPI00142C2804